MASVHFKKVVINAAVILDTLEENADKVDLYATPHTNDCQFLEVDDDYRKVEGGELLTVATVYYHPALT